MHARPETTVSLRWPAGLDARGFLSRYWQRRPLLLRSAVDPATLPLPDDDRLAGLALSPEVESRLVRHRRGAHWRLEHGPFTASQLRRLARRDWTLLLQDVDSHWPATRAIFDLVAFIAPWRREDLMVSLAAPGGTVGAHVDQYDVFLLQVRGRREWRIGRPETSGRLREDVPLALLAHFEEAERWMLAPGDILYLPPGVPHHGIAADDQNLCVTASLGFRAPEAGELSVAMIEAQLAALATVPRYSDAGVTLREAQGGEIGAAAIARLERLLEALPDRRLACARALARLATEVKPWLAPLPRRRGLGASALWRRLARGDRLRLAAGARAAWVRTGGGAAELYVNGCCWTLPPGCRRLAEHLAGPAATTGMTALPQRASARGAALAVLCQLYLEGLLEIVRP
ncbi:MAG: cupin domain-containing protein [Gammaproteobacteria bacterium]|nr:MAG: cupin domain-containing protein [Gammaproteobacteria bacterium]